ELIVRDDHLHGVLVLVHDDARHLRGRQRAADVLRGIGGPVDDVDLLVAQLLHYRLHAGTPPADAGADRVDVAVVRRDGDLGPAARLARRALHLDDALVDLRHLLAEQLDQEPGVGPRQDDLRPPARELDVDDVRADAIALPVALARDLL